MELFANPGELEAYPVNMFGLTQQIDAIIPPTQRIMAVMFHMRGLVATKINSVLSSFR